ncbi:MAG: hypothetical protein C5B55_12970, partial [Blastocatellia bacterium]
QHRITELSRETPLCNSNGGLVMEKANGKVTEVTGAGGRPKRVYRLNSVILIGGCVAKDT